MSDKPYELHCGDAVQVLRQIIPASVDMVIADPPYSSGGQFRCDRSEGARDKYSRSNDASYTSTFTGDNRDQRGYMAWSHLWMSEARNATAAGGVLCVFTDWRQLPVTTDAIQAAGWVWRGIVPWCKKVARPMKGRYRQSSEFVVWATNGPRPIEGECGAGHVVSDAPQPRLRDHLTQKPLAVTDALLAICPSGGTVLDPFNGSGTTGVSAVASGRRYIGIELDPDYIAISERRISEALTLQDAS